MVGRPAASAVALDVEPRGLLRAILGILSPEAMTRDTGKTLFGIPIIEDDSMEPGRIEFRPWNEPFLQPLLATIALGNHEYAWVDLINARQVSENNENLRVQYRARMVVRWSLREGAD
jgi:hypothetical protein